MAVSVWQLAREKGERAIDRLVAGRWLDMEENQPLRERDLMEMENVGQIVEGTRSSFDLYSAYRTMS